VDTKQQACAPSSPILACYFVPFTASVILPMNSEPDFEKYSEKELKEALDSIDKIAHPERVNEIKSLLILKQKERENGSDNGEEKLSKESTLNYFEPPYIILNVVSMLALFFITAAGSDGAISKNHTFIGYMLVITINVAFCFLLKVGHLIFRCFLLMLLLLLWLNLLKAI